MHLSPDMPPSSEAMKLARIAGPLAAAYLAEYLMFVTTKLVVGELGVAPLGAVGLGGSLAFEAMVIGIAALSVTGVLAAQAEGAGRKAEAGRAARHGLLVACLIAAPFTWLVWNLDAVMRLTGQDAEVAALSRPFLAALAPSVLATFIFTALRAFASALARTGAIMAINVAAVGLNWLLAEALVHGRWGAPELGIAGAGAATSITSWAMLIALALHIWRTPSLRGYGLFRGRFWLEPAVLRTFVRLGVPIAAMVGVEAGLFTAVGLLSGVIGAEMLAAHQVVMSWIGVPFVLALGFAEGAMVRVAHAMGRRDMPGARLSGLLALGLGSGLIALMVVAPLSMAEPLVRLFLPASAPGYAAVLALVEKIILIAAIFQVFDGAQAIMSRALRGLRDAWAPLGVAAFGYWVVGIGGGSLLAFPMGMGGPGLWTGLAAGLIVAALLLTRRFLRMTSARCASSLPTLA